MAVVRKGLLSASKSGRFLLICVAFIMLSMLMHGSVMSTDPPVLVNVSWKRKEREIAHQQVMILSGSLHTGLSSLNKELSRLGKEYQLGSWSWSVPDIVRYNYTRDQGFDPLVDSMIYGLSHKLEMGPRYDDPQREAADYFLKEYRYSFVAEWMKEKSIIIGSDKFYTIANIQGGDGIIDSLIGMLPWNHPQFSLSGSNEDVTALIFHRRLRLENLVSLWRSTLDQPNNTVVDSNNGENISFSKWLLSTDRVGDIDSLGIAETFLQKGIHVILVDVDDLLDNHQSLGHFVLCKILHVRCSNIDDTKVEKLKSAVPDLDASVKMNQLGLHKSTLKEIEEALLQYECRYHYYRNHKRVELAQVSLSEFFSSCAARVDKTSKLSRVEFNLKMKQILHNK